MYVCAAWTQTASSFLDYRCVIFTADHQSLGQLSNTLKLIKFDHLVLQLRPEHYSAMSLTLPMGLGTSFVFVGVRFQVFNQLERNCAALYRP